MKSTKYVIIIHDHKGLRNPSTGVEDFYIQNTDDPHAIGLIVTEMFGEMEVEDEDRRRFNVHVSTVTLKDEFHHVFYCNSSEYESTFEHCCSNIYEAIALSEYLKDEGTGVAYETFQDPAEVQAFLRGCEVASGFVGEGISFELTANHN
jgi:hypothetical protein